MLAVQHKLLLSATGLKLSRDQESCSCSQDVLRLQRFMRASSDFPSSAIYSKRQHGLTLSRHSAWDFAGAEMKVCIEKGCKDAAAHCYKSHPDNVLQQEQTI